MNRTRRPGCEAQPADDERIRALYEAHGPALLRALAQWTRGDRWAAEDLLQETMLRAWRGLHTLDERPIRPWLMTIARRLAIDASRGRAARPPECGDEPLAHLATGRDELGRVLDRMVLAGAMSGLSRPQRTVLFHVYYLHGTMRQTAETLGIPEGTVKTRSRNAIRTLRSGVEY